MKPPKLKSQNKKNSSSASSKNSYLADDDNFQNFSNQLSKLGLELRDITGDGNCCFRALSDQMEGNETHHLDYRKRVCQYMRQNREEFEPFVAALIDDEDEDQQANKKASNKKLDAFDKYIKNLDQAGTYADNGCLVAFARLYQVNINIHQLNLPIWTINGITGNNKNRPIRELHLSYHNGEHYSSIRTLGDQTNTPTKIFYLDDSGSIQAKNTSQKSKAKTSLKSNVNSSAKYDYSSLTDSDFLMDNFESLNLGNSDLNFNDKVEKIIDITKCNDVDLIKEILVENNFDLEMSINCVISNQFGSQNEENYSEQCSGRLKKVDKKYEKKQRQMERQRNKVLEQREKESMASGVQKEIGDGSQSQCQASGVNLNQDLNLNLSTIQTKAI